MPADWRVGIVPASDTGAIEMALWSMLGARPVDVLAHESFSEAWATDVIKQLKLPGARVLNAAYGELPTLADIDFSHDVVLAWNGTTSGVRFPNGDFIPDTREGLVFADSTSAAFAMDLPWPKLDVVTWSWQKVLGGEAGHGMLALSPRAVERLLTFKPAWPLPKIFRLTSGGKLIEGIFAGETINTPSMLAVEDALDGLRWANSIGGLPALIARSEQNLAAIADWAAHNPRIDFLAKDPATRSCTSICLSHHGRLVRRARPRSPAKSRQIHRRAAGKIRRRPGRRRLPRRPAGPAHLGRCDGGNIGYRKTAALDRLRDRYRRFGI